MGSIFSRNFRAMIQDTFGRLHDYMRISLTDACNFRCFYCMPDEEVEVTPHHKLMSSEEIFRMASAFVEMGVKKIRLTGGEPLVRKDFAQIVTLLASLPVRLTLTSNGVLLHKYKDLLWEAGVRSINISLDTLDPVRFFALTKRDHFNQVKRNIDTFLEAGFHVKVNVVVMKGINDEELRSFVEWTRNEAIHIRFIEFMPFDRNQWHAHRVFTLEEILSEISKSFYFTKIADEKNDTCKKYQCVHHAGTFAIISTMSHPFCATCNRLRLTADGKLKNCLFSKNETDLLTAMRNNESITELILANVKSKAEALGGQLLHDFYKLNPSELQNRSMIAIGG